MFHIVFTITAQSYRTGTQEWTRETFLSQNRTYYWRDLENRGVKAMNDADVRTGP